MTIKPSGNNSLGAKYAYVQRKHYDTVVSDKESENLTFLDLYKYPLYGKLNLDNEIITPRQDMMVSHEGIVGTFEFISLALNDLSAALKKRASNGTLKQQGQYAAMQLTERDNNWRNDYLDYLQETREVYNKEFIGGRKNDITNFGEFLSSFLRFSSQLLPSFPFTFSQYYISNQSSIFSTGLAVDLNNERYGNDDVNYSDYIEDINFPVFSREAQNHGFILDKHAPFRLVANLKSKPMTEYMKKTGYENMSDVFDRMFFKPLVPEFYEFVNFASSVYIQTFPEDYNYTEVCHKNGTTYYTIKEREVFDASQLGNTQDIISYIGEDVWLRAYCFIKIRESNKNFTQKEFDDFVREVTAMNKYVDIEAALVYINKRIDPLKVSEFSGKPTFRF
jgi:hypothetical protein